MKTRFGFITLLLSFEGMLFCQESKIALTTVEDYFETQHEVSLEIPKYQHAENGTCTERAAHKGIFWSTAQGQEFNFFASHLRDTVNKHLEYTITEYMYGYVPLQVSFGSYCDKDTVKDFTVDLTKNAVVQLQIENPAFDNYNVNVGVRLIDIHNQSLSFDKGILQDQNNWLLYNIGFLEEHTSKAGMPGSLGVGSIKTLVYDFKDAIGAIKPPFNDLKNLYPDNSNFDFSQVKALSFLVTNTETDGTSGPPLDLIEKKLHIKKLTLGINPVVTHTHTDTQGIVFEAVTVYDQLGTLLYKGPRDEALLHIQGKSGLFIIKSSSGATKVIVP